jgi:hypothetical protein
MVRMRSHFRVPALSRTEEDIKSEYGQSRALLRNTRPNKRRNVGSRPAKSTSSVVDGLIAARLLCIITFWRMKTAG